MLSALPSYEQAVVTQAQLNVAFARSRILQVEDPNDPGLAPWIAGHGFVRIDGAALPADQQTPAQLGAQLLQTDSPWSQFDDLGPAIPLRSYRAGDAPSLLREPGNRSLLLPSTLGEQSLDGARLFLRDAARWHRRDLERLHGDERAFVCIAHTGTCAARDALIRDGGVVRSEA